MIAASNPVGVNGAPVAYPIPLASVLDEVVDTLSRFMIFEHVEQAHAIALWIAHTYAIEQLSYTPRLAIRSAIKGSGKSRLGAVIALVAREGWAVAMPSMSVLFRKLDGWSGTVVWDEADEFFRKRNEDIADAVALLNEGNRRGSIIPRSVPKGSRGWEVYDFSIYAPVCLIGIGTRWPETVLDRCIVVRIAKRREGDRKPERLRQSRDAFALRELGQRLGQAVRGVAIDLETVNEIEWLEDRAFDNWEPLFALADAAGGNWSERARDAARVLYDSRLAETVGDEEPVVRFVRDMLTVFVEQGYPEFLPTLDLCHALNESGWYDARFGGSLDEHRMRTILAPAGLMSVQRRAGGGKRNRGHALLAVYNVALHLGAFPDEWDWTPERANAAANVSELQAPAPVGLLPTAEPVRPLVTLTGNEVAAMKAAGVRVESVHTSDGLRYRVGKSG